MGNSPINDKSHRRALVKLQPVSPDRSATRTSGIYIYIPGEQFPEDETGGHGKAQPKLLRQSRVFFVLLEFQDHPEAESTKDGKLARLETWNANAD